MRTIKVQERAVEAVRQSGSCIVQYCPGHTIPAFLKEGDVIVIVGKETGKEVTVEIVGKTVEKVISVKFKKVATGFS